jgi:hypothetical protein
MKPGQKKYRSYLLRLWQVQLGEGIGMRASLEDVQSSELHGFEDLAALVVFLEVLKNDVREDEVGSKPEMDQGIQNRCADL